MTNYGQIVATLALGAWFFAAPIHAQQTMRDVPTIVTPGEAVITRAPDRAWVIVATDARAAHPVDARKLGAQAMTDVQAALRATGLAGDALRTIAFSLEPETSWSDGHANLIGYVAHNQIEVRVDDLDKLPAVLDAANVPKNVTLSIVGPRFDVRDRATLEKQALASAVEDAMSRAQAMAQGAKATLGSIQSIENQTPAVVVGPQPRLMAPAGSAPVETPVTPGTIEIRAQVLLTIAIH